MLVEKEARIIPSEAKRPPTIITGRQPKRFTRMLHRGPGRSAATSAFEKYLINQPLRSRIFQGLEHFLWLGTASTEANQLGQRPSTLQWPLASNHRPVTSRCCSEKPFNRRLPQLCNSPKRVTRTGQYLPSCTVPTVWTHAYLCLRVLCNMARSDADVSHPVCAHFVQRHSLIRDPERAGLAQQTGVTQLLILRYRRRLTGQYAIQSAPFQKTFCNDTRTLVNATAH